MIRDKRWDEVENMSDSEYEDFLKSEAEKIIEAMKSYKPQPVEKYDKEYIIERLGKGDAKVCMDLLSECDLSKLSNEDYNSLVVLFEGLLKYENDGFSSDYDVLDNYGDYFSDNAKDYAEILLLLKYGRDIKLTATIPHKGHQTIEIDKAHLIFKLREGIDDLLYDHMRKLGRESELNRRRLLDFTPDESLGRIINNYGFLDEYRLALKGRGKNIPKLGKYVYRIVEKKHKSIFSNMNESDKYYLLGSFLVYAGFVPSYSWEEWEVLEKKHKRNVVKSWVESYGRVNTDVLDESKQKLKD